MSVTDASQQTSETALAINIAHAQVVADTVRSTLGPKGLDKMLADAGGRVTITNDGATILRNVNWVSPIAKKIVEVARTQEEQCYDGTTTAIILTAELLKQAQMLLDRGVHPTTIVEGYRAAVLHAKEHLNGLAIVPDDDLLLQVAKTAMTGKSAEGERDHLAKLCLEVVDASRPESVHIMTRTGSPISDSFSPNGIVIGRQKMHNAMPKSVDDVKLALIDGNLELEGFGSGVNLNLNSYSEAEEYRKVSVPSSRRWPTTSSVSVRISFSRRRTLTPGWRVLRQEERSLRSPLCGFNLEAIAESCAGLIVSRMGRPRRRRPRQCREVRGSHPRRSATLHAPPRHPHRQHRLSHHLCTH